MPLSALVCRMVCAKATKFVCLEQKARSIFRFFGSGIFDFWSWKGLEKVLIFFLKNLCEPCYSNPVGESFIKKNSTNGCSFVANGASVKSGCSSCVTRTRDQAPSRAKMCTKPLVLLPLFSVFPSLFQQKRFRSSSSGLQSPFSVRKKKAVAGSKQKTFLRFSGGGKIRMASIPFPATDGVDKGTSRLQKHCLHATTDRHTDENHKKRCSKHRHRHRTWRSHNSDATTHHTFQILVLERVPVLAVDLKRLAFSFSVAYLKMAGATRPKRRALENSLLVWWDKYISVPGTSSPLPKRLHHFVVTLTK